MSALYDNAELPFDSIRRFTQDGQEYWTARELMPLLGYTRWDRVPDVIERAKLACSNGGNTVSEHFSEEARKTKGRPHQDFKLSRLACYLIAMNGDPRKPEIAMAQTYFAIKTREAEVIIPQQAIELETLRLKLELAHAERDAAVAQKSLLDKREAIKQFHNETTAALILGATIVTDPNPIEKVIDTATGNTYQGIGISALSLKLGFGKNTKACWAWLESIGYGKESGCWQEQPTTVAHPKLLPEHYHELLRQWGSGTRQTFLGE